MSEHDDEREELLNSNLCMLLQGKWQDRPVLYVAPARRIARTPPEDPADFDYEAAVAFEIAKRESPLLAKLYESERQDPEIWFVDLSEGLPLTFSNQVSAALWCAEKDDREGLRRGIDMPKGYEVHIHYLPVPGSAQKSRGFQADLGKVESGELEGFLYEITLLAHRARTGAQAQNALCIGEAHLLRLNGQI